MSFEAVRWRNVLARQVSKKVTPWFRLRGVSHHASTTYSFITLFGGGDLLTFGMLAMVGVNHVNVFFFCLLL
jgi:hypothetical protein